MNDIPLEVLVGALAALIVLLAGFSGAETGIMTVNRYRLRQLAKSGHRGARIAFELLKRPDRLIGLLLLGNNLVTIAAATVATLIALRLGGGLYLAAAVALLTLLVLIVGEALPKTFANLHPERVAFSSSYVLIALMRLFHPLVWAINLMVSGLLRCFGVRASDRSPHKLSREELRIIVNEAGALIPRRHQKMLVNLLDLQKATVEDIMVPRNEIVGIDLEHDIAEIIQQITHSQYTRVPVYRGGVDRIEGVVHLRKLLPSIAAGQLDHAELVNRMQKAYFIPEGTDLHTQLLNFQRNRCRSGMVVDEYGDIVGLATLEDILEEIVGEFTTDPSANPREVDQQPDGSFLVEGSASVRELNRILDWGLPTDGPKTLNGVILEYLESIPESGVSVLVAGIPVTILQTKGNRVRIAQVFPLLRKRQVPG